MGNAWENRPYLVNVPFVGAAGQEVRDLPVRGRISALIFETEWDNLVGGDNTLNPIDMMQLIEIVHRGSEVIKSMTGIQHAMVAWRRGCGYPYNFSMKLSAGTQRMQIYIPFGRYPYDREYGLTLDNLINPQIRFTWDNAYAASGDAAGGFAAAVGDWSIRLLYAPDNVNFRGYIRTTRVDQWLEVAGTRRFTEMPKQYKWPRIYVQQECVDRNILFNCTEFELQADNRAWVPVTLDQWALQTIDTTEFGRVELCDYYQHANQALIPAYSLLDHPWQSQYETQGGAGATCGNIAQGVFDPTIDALSSGVNVEGKVIQRGWGFGRGYCIPLCPPNQEAWIEDHCLDSTAYGRIVFETQHAVGVGTTPWMTVILEELVPA